MTHSSASFSQVFLTIAILMAGCFAQTAKESVCEPSPEVRKALKALPNYWEYPSLTNWQAYQQRNAKLDALLLQYPNDVFVERTYIQSATFLRGVDKASVERKAKINARYKALHEQQPDNPRADYLYGITLVGRDTAQAIQLLDAALARDPNFTLPHLQLTGIYGSGVFQDKRKSLDHLKTFLDACPATIDGYGSLSWAVSDKEVLTHYARTLRAALEKRTDSDVPGGYQVLWGLEFKTHSPSDYPLLGQQVARDLERLRKLNFTDEHDWYSALADGYKLANDQKRAEWAKDEGEKRFPTVGQLPDKVKWHKDHPEPDAEASAAAREAYYRALLAETDTWLKQPAASALVTFHILEDRVDAMKHLDDVPAPEVIQSVEQMVKYGAENGGDGPFSSDFSPWSSDYRHAAEVLSRKNIAPELVVDYARKGLTIVEVENSQPIPDLYATKDNVADSKFYRSYSGIEMLKYEIGGHLAMKQADQAAPLLARMDQQTQDMKSLAGDDEGRKQVYARWRSEYWGMRAQEAEVRGRKIDALSFYQNALLARLDARLKPPANQKDELAENAHRLWTSLNGTEEGWQLWYGRRAAELSGESGFTFQKVNQPLQPFELADLDDRKWNLEGLKGKVTLISFWATWCGPCREELPHLQKLMQQYKSRGDIQFISMNLDDNPGLIQPFLKEHELSMVVIPAMTFAVDTLKVNGIPQNWIVDDQGMVRMKSDGYDSSEKWGAGMQSAIEALKATPASPSTGSGSQ